LREEEEVRAIPTFLKIEVLILFIFLTKIKIYIIDNNELSYM
jgi:hypothetical protein